MDAAVALVLAAFAIWLLAAAALSAIDIRTRTLPTRLIWMCAAAVTVLLAAASWAAGEPSLLAAALTGAAASSVPLAVIHLVHPPSMGFGDVRFSALNGLLCGWWGWQMALLGLSAAFLAAFPEAFVVLVARGVRTSRPLGPYLAAGTAVVVVWAMYNLGVVPSG